MHTRDLSRYSMASPRGLRPAPAPRGLLFGFATNLLAAPLAGQRLLGPALVAGLQVEAVLLDVLDDVFLLDLSLEAPEGVFDRLALLDLDLGQNAYTPSLWWISLSRRMRFLREQVFAQIVPVLKDARASPPVCQAISQAISEESRAY